MSMIESELICPNCANKYNIECTTAGILSGKDTNRATCGDCGYSGFAYEFGSPDKSLEDYDS